MKTIEKSAGQDLKDFEKMMEEIKPYSPPKKGIVIPEYLPYRIENPLRIKKSYNY